MPYVQPADISSILNSFAQLGQANALVRQRRDQAAAEAASGRAALGSIAGGIGGGILGGPIGAAAGSAAGARLLGGERTSGAQVAQGAGQAYQMAQGQQAYQQNQADRAALADIGRYLNPEPQVQSAVVNTPGFTQFSDAPEGAPESQPAMSQRETTITPGQRDVPGAISAAFRAQRPDVAISLMSAEAKGDKGFTLGKDQARYDAQGNLIVERGGGSGEDDPNKTEFERNLIRVTNRAIERQDITPEQAKEFKDNVIRQKMARTETTNTGGKIEGIDIAAAIKAMKTQGTGPSVIPIKAGEKPFTPEQAAKVGMINSAITTHAALRQALATPEGFDRQTIAAMNANVPFTEGRQRRQEFKDAIEARLRAESGAAVPDSEVARAMDRFMPSSLDSDAAIQSKLDRFDAWLRDTSWLIQEGRTPRPEEPKKTGDESKLINKYGLRPKGQ